MITYKLYVMWRYFQNKDNLKLTSSRAQRSIECDLIPNRFDGRYFLLNLGLFKGSYTNPAFL